MRDCIYILKTPVDNISLEEALLFLDNCLKSDRPHKVYTPNAELLFDAFTKPDFGEIFRKGDLLTADGMGVLLASKILGKPLKEKVSGIDLVKAAFDRYRTTNHSFFLFGGKPGVAQKAAENIRSAYPGIGISGSCNGYFSEEDIPGILKQINDSGAGIVLVALGGIKQETFINNYCDKSNAKIFIGVGGCLDVFAGEKKMAPEFIRKIGFEWLYHLIKQPSRYKRIFKLPAFVIAVIMEKIGTGKKHTG